MMPSKILRDAMVADARFNGWNISISRQMPNPDKNIAIYDLSGRSRLTVLGDGSKDKLFPRIMFRIRGEKLKYNEAYAMCETVMSWVRSQTAGIVSGSDKLAYYSSMGSIDHIGYDTSDRPEFIFNFILVQMKM